jgi:hypothetical protein
MSDVAIKNKNTIMTKSIIHLKKQYMKPLSLVLMFAFLLYLVYKI